MRDIDFRNPTEHAVYVDNRISKMASIARLQFNETDKSVKYHGRKSIARKDNFGNNTGIFDDYEADLTIEKSYLQRAVDHVLYNLHVELEHEGLKQEADLAMHGIDIMVAKEIK